MQAGSDSASRASSSLSYASTRPASATAGEPSGAPPGAPPGASPGASSGPVTDAGRRESGESGQSSVGTLSSVGTGCGVVGAKIGDGLAPVLQAAIATAKQGVPQSFTAELPKDTATSASPVQKPQPQRPQQAQQAQQQAPEAEQGEAPDLIYFDSPEPAAAARPALKFPPPPSPPSGPGKGAPPGGSRPPCRPGKEPMAESETKPESAAAWSQKLVPEAAPQRALGILVRVRV